MTTWRTQPVCDPCFRHRNPDRVPLRLLEAARATEHCCWCGEATRSGIYQRLDIDAVPHPQEVTRP